MNTHISTIQEFLTRCQIRLARPAPCGYDEDVYQLVSLDDQGTAQAIKNPPAERRKVEITLTRKELALLASLCFPDRPLE